MRRRTFSALTAGAIGNWPFVVRGQQPGRHRIGILTVLPGETTSRMPLLLGRLQQLGYSEGGNLTVERRSAEGQAERLPQLAAELVGLHPDVLVTGFGTLTAKAAKAATATIPVVFTTVGDPVGAGLVESLRAPRGNVTGLTDQASDAAAKRLELLRDITGGKNAFAVLCNPDTPYSALALGVIQSAAGPRGIRVTVVEVRNTDDVLRSVANLGSDVAGLLVLEDALTGSLRGQIADLALKHRLPTSFQTRDTSEASGLMSYGADRRDLYVRAADYVDRIFKGAKPGDLPVEQATKFEFVINLRTAKALGLSVSPALLATADEVIE